MEYGYSLTRFFEFCDTELIPLEACLPASEFLIYVFVASRTGKLVDLQPRTTSPPSKHGIPYMVPPGLEKIVPGVEHGTVVPL